MSKTFERIDEGMREWLDKQHMFFVGTAPLDAEGMINCSPKGYDCFRVLSDHEVAYLDLTGSGVETIAHLKENGRIVFMFCSFDQTPRIVRFHATGFVHEKGTPEFERLMEHFEPHDGMRSIVRAEVTRVSDSCGYGVPRYEYLGDRQTLVNYWNNKGEEGTREYQQTRNATSLNGLVGVQCEEQVVGSK